MARIDAAYRGAVTLAVRAFSARPQVVLVDGPRFDNNGAEAQVTFDLDFGGRWRALGESPWGVRPEEVVTLRFLKTFPSRPPKISLRPDFSRNHPHIQPHLADGGGVVPCLVEGRLDEFLAAAGFEGLAVQTFAWLTAAAEGRLMDGAPGWEPARRDGLSDVLSADPYLLRDLADGKGGFQFFSTDYFCLWDLNGMGSAYWGNLGPRSSVQTEIREGKLKLMPRYAQGSGLAVAVWAGPDADGGPWICDHYLPDDVGTVGDLIVRARDYGVHAPLEQAVRLIRQQVDKRQHGDTPVIVLILVRRPKPLIGTESPIEILAYLVPCHHPGGVLGTTADAVRPVGILTALSDRLLTRLSGVDPLPKWALLGAGSLGSKLALHLARQASPPVIVADQGSLTPHNAVRHGLHPRGGELDWAGPKVETLVTVLNGLGAEAKALKGDHLKLAATLGEMRGNRRPRWLVNTTASMVARETLSASAFAKLPRQIEMALYRSGGIGVMAVEGDQRNPNTLELIYGLYQRAADDLELGTWLLADDGFARIETGEGCGSVTMVMTDARISAQAALLAEAFTALPESATGGIRLFERGDDLGVSVRDWTEPAFERVRIDGMPGWTLTLSSEVQGGIAAEIARWPDVETGGVLIGRASYLAQTIVVTALEPAPPDSVRRPDLFELGTEGLLTATQARREASRGLLDVVGTWHSHLGSARPSAMDRGSAALVGIAATAPMAFLIKGVDHYAAIAATPSDEEQA